MRTRTRWPKGTWMKLRSPEILVAFMNDKNFSVARLARCSDCSKSFIGFLRTGAKTSCTPALAERIAEALDVPLVALFDAKTSAVSGRNTNGRAA